MWRSLFRNVGETPRTSFCHPKNFEKTLGFKIGFAIGAHHPKSHIGLCMASPAHTSQHDKLEILFFLKLNTTI